MQTVNRIRRELDAIDSRLVHEYKIEPHRNGVKLTLKEITIISQKTRSENGPLYEIYPKVNNCGFRKLYGTIEDVARDLSLKEAIMIAELTSGSRYIPGLTQLDADLSAIAKLYFGDAQNKIKSENSLTGQLKL